MRHWKRTILYLTEHAKSGIKDLKKKNFNLEDNDRSGASKKFDELKELCNENPIQIQEELAE